MYSESRNDMEQVQGETNHLLASHKEKLGGKILHLTTGIED